MFINLVFKNIFILLNQLRLNHFCLNTQQHFTRISNFAQVIWLRKSRNLVLLVLFSIRLENLQIDNSQIAMKVDSGRSDDTTWLFRVAKNMVPVSNKHKNIEPVVISFGGHLLK